MKPKRKCSNRRCRVLIDYDKKYCDKHKEDANKHHKTYDKYKRDRRSMSLYHSVAWRKLRRQALIRDEWLCQMCLKEGILTQAKIGDHIIPIKQDWDKRLDIDNIQSLCMSCHNKKTNEENKKTE